MLVVADISPINYLLLIDMIHVLPEIFGVVCIPADVLDELRSFDAPSRAFFTRP